ncbi:hypothetical protein [Vibrio fluvialis]|uniref:hypothetical protein n=1 Tax=Vibrio fluvialis TaxID=676 RepID=UPI00390537F1
MSSGVAKFRNVVLVSFNKQGDIEQHRALSVNVSDEHNEVERRSIERAVSAMLNDDRATIVMICIGRHHEAEFDSAESALKWASRELFGVAA